MERQRQTDRLANVLVGLEIQGGQTTVFDWPLTLKCFFEDVSCLMMMMLMMEIANVEIRGGGDYTVYCNSKICFEIQGGADRCLPRSQDVKHYQIYHFLFEEALPVDVLTSLRMVQNLVRIFFAKPPRKLTINVNNDGFRKKTSWIIAIFTTKQGLF